MGRSYLPDPLDLSRLGLPTSMPRPAQPTTPGGLPQAQGLPSAPTGTGMGQTSLQQGGQSFKPTLMPPVSAQGGSAWGGFAPQQPAGGSTPFNPTGPVPKPQGGAFTSPGKNAFGLPMPAGNTINGIPGGSGPFAQGGRPGTGMEKIPSPIPNAVKLPGFNAGPRTPGQMPGAPGATTPKTGFGDIAKGNLPQPSLLPAVPTTPATGPKNIEFAPGSPGSPGATAQASGQVVKEEKTVDFAPGVAGAPGATPQGQVASQTEKKTNPAQGGAAAGQPPKSEWQIFMDEAKATLAGLANLEDVRVQAAINRAVTNAGLMNQAERDALQMQINQDPSLRGQGAGRALLQVMARDQGFSMDQMLATLSSENIDRIINLQKYGLEMGLKFNEIKHERDQEALKTLMSLGNFEGAASAANRILNDQFPGININVSAADLKGRDPQELTKMSQKLSFIKDLAKANPQAALPLIASLLNDPQFKDYFPAGMTPEQILASFQTGQVSEGIQQSKPIQESINALALSGQSFDETGKSYPELFRLLGRDAVKEGRKLSLEDANAIRQSEGLPAFSRDASGNLVDENGVLLDDEDFKELAYRADYAERVKTAKTKPWEAMKKSILESPMGKFFMDENLFPGGNAALDKFLMAYSLGADAFTRDPVTGEIVPNWDKLNLSLNSPEMWPIFHNWPAASFDAQGNVMKNPDGSLVYNAGGYVYGETVNGQKISSTPDDEELDKAYFAYRNSGGKLGPQDWYLSTMGGKKTPDESKIPISLKNPDLSGGVLGAGENVGKFEETFKALKASEVEAKMKDPAFVKQAIESGMIKNANSVEAIANPEFWQGVLENGYGYFSVNGKVLKVVKPSSSEFPVVHTVTGSLSDGDYSYVVVTDSDGKTWEIITKGTSSKLPAGTVRSGDTKTTLDKF